MERSVPSGSVSRPAERAPIIVRRSYQQARIHGRRVPPLLASGGLTLLALLGSACAPGDGPLTDATGDVYLAEIRLIQETYVPGQWQESAPSALGQFFVPTASLVRRRVALDENCLLYLDAQWESEPATSGMVFETILQRGSVRYDATTGLNEFEGLADRQLIAGSNDSLRLVRHGEVVAEVPAPSGPFAATSLFGTFEGVDTRFHVPASAEFDLVYSVAVGTARGGATATLRCAYPRERLAASVGNYEMKLVSDALQDELSRQGVSVHEVTIGYGNRESSDIPVEGHETWLMLDYVWRLRVDGSSAVGATSPAR